MGGLCGDNREGMVRSLNFLPHEYQQYAIDFIETHNRSVLLLDMGLGKTVITLTAINTLMYDSFEINRALVVAPLRVAKYTWSDESAKWDHLKALRLSVICGSEKERWAAVNADADVYIINRENLVWLTDNFPKLQFDMIVYDELSSFKNHQSKRFKAASLLSAKAYRTVGLTGTPASNGLMDLFAEYKIIDGGQRLGRLIGQYRTAYFRPGRTNGHIVYDYIPLKGAEDKIYERISDITVSMKAVEHLQMPELISLQTAVLMDETETQKYKDLKDDLILDEPEITAANAAALSNKLQQMANGAVYDDDKKTVHIHDRKLDALEDIIEAQNGKPLLVAYWYKHDLERIKQRLTAIKLKDWDTLDTEQSIRRWNAGQLSVALIHPASAGHGLNLQSGGSCVAWFGLTWSLELYQQCNARLYRQGQQHTVVIQHIITKNTIDERIMKALQNKDHTQQELIDAVKAEVCTG